MGVEESSHLVRHHDQRVLVLGQEVEEAPEAKGVFQGDAGLAVGPVVLLGSERPAQLVEILLHEGALLHLTATTHTG